MFSGLFRQHQGITTAQGRSFFAGNVGQFAANTPCWLLLQKSATGLDKLLQSFQYDSSNEFIHVP